MRVPGVLDSRFSLRVLRVAGADVLALGPGSLPEPMQIASGDAGEAVEGLRVTISGIVTEAPTSLTDGLGLMVDDGTGARAGDRRRRRARRAGRRDGIAR